MALDSSQRGKLVLAGLAGDDRVVLVFSNLSDAQHDSNSPACDTTATMSYRVAVVSAAAPPSVQRVDPNRLEPGSAAYLWVYGSDLREGVQVAFSGTGVAVESVDFIDASTLGVAVATEAAAADGTRDLTVTNPDGQSTTLAGAVMLGTATTSAGGCVVAAGGDGLLAALAAVGLLLARRRRR
jgi:MYXO-CTERM domain-containing protein